MGKTNFTADRISAFQCPQGKPQVIFWDAKTPGLGLRVTQAGAKSFIFETRLHRKTIRSTIGDPRTWTIKEAQAEATRLKAMTDQGIDPRAMAKEKQAAAEAQRREAEVEAARRETSVKQAWDSYVAARSPKWSDRHLANHHALTSPGGKPRKRGRRPGDTELTTSGPLHTLMSKRLAELDAEANGLISISSGAA